MAQSNKRKPDLARTSPGPAQPDKLRAILNKFVLDITKAAQRQLLSDIQAELPKTKATVDATLNMNEAEVALYDGEIIGYNQALTEVTALLNQKKESL